MQIQAIRLHPIRIPLNFQFKQSNNSGTSQSLSAIMALHTADGVTGYGESCPRTYVTGEEMEDVSRDLAALEPELIRDPIDTLEKLREKLKEWTERGIGPSTRCALELAWLDAWSRSKGQSPADLLNITYRGTLSYSLILPLVPVAALEKLLTRLSGFSPPAVKLKAGADQSDNLLRIKFLQEHFGPRVPLRLDVNGGWTLEQARQYIPQMLELGVRSFEQILDPQDLDGMRKLTQEFGAEAGIMADESLLSLADATHLLDNRICNHFNLKISKLGGLFATLDVYRLAESRGVPCQLGAHFGETSLLSSAGALLAGLVEGKLTACEGALGELLLKKDIGQPSIQHAGDGSLALAGLWRAPGLVDTVLPHQFSGLET